MHESTQNQGWVTKSWHSQDDQCNAEAHMIQLPVEGVTGLGGVGKYKLGKGFEFKPHRHRDWVVVTVLKGRIKVATGGDTETCIYKAGDTYLAKPGELHRETMLEDSELVVVIGPLAVGQNYATTVVDV